MQITGVAVNCPLCDRGGPFLVPPDIIAANKGAIFSVKLENSGSMGTVILNHNLTFHNLRPEESPIHLASEEVPCPNDGISVPLGAHSSAMLTLERGEVIVFEMRNPQKFPPPGFPAYLHGHFTYRNAFFVPIRRHFCFQYHAPSKGLAEFWAVCETKP